jgi:hypothetical protein
MSALTGLASKISKERNCSQELVRAILTDFLAATHETIFKEQMGTALVDAYWELGELGAYHFMCVISAAAEHSPGYQAEHYKRLDPSLKRFATIRDQWQQEIDYHRG